MFENAVTPLATPCICDTAMAGAINRFGAIASSSPRIDWG
jgi:hypothetical protein